MNAQVALIAVGAIAGFACAALDYQIETPDPAHMPERCRVAVTSLPLVKRQFQTRGNRTAVSLARAGCTPPVAGSFISLPAPGDCVAQEWRAHVFSTSFLTRFSSTFPIKWRKRSINAIKQNTLTLQNFIPKMKSRFDMHRISVGINFRSMQLTDNHHHYRDQAFKR